MNAPNAYAPRPSRNGCHSPSGRHFTKSGRTSISLVTAATYRPSADTCGKTLICYIAGADPYKEDQLGGLNLTIEGLKKRDELVFRVARAKNIPVMVTYAGGYARDVEDTVIIHSNTVLAAKEVFSGIVSPQQVGP